MDTWVRYRRSRAEYTGRITRGPLVEWLTTAAGRAPLDAAEAQMRVPVLARTRAARRAWRRFAAAAADRDVVAIVQSELDAYLTRLEEFAYAEALPRVGVNLHRLGGGPRLLLHGATPRPRKRGPPAR